MGAGAIFLAFQLAPTEEMVLIGYQITGWQAAALAVVSLGIMQAFLLSIEAKGRKTIFCRRTSSWACSCASQLLDMHLCFYLACTCSGPLDGWTERQYPKL